MMRSKVIGSVPWKQGTFLFLNEILLENSYCFVEICLRSVLTLNGAAVEKLSAML